MTPDPTGEAAARRTWTVVCHASHVGGTISERGTYQVERLIRGLEGLGGGRSAIVTSSTPRAKATAEAIAAAFGDTPVFESRELTPGSGTPGTYRRLVTEVAGSHPPGSDLVLVGHEGRLSNLLTELTGRRHRPFANGEAVVVREQEPGGFGFGAGEVVTRWPVVAHDEEAVRAKLSSKMTPTAVLAGFVLAALVGIVTNPPGDGGWWTTASVFLLTVSTGALVGALFIYDQLSMPSGFWTDGPRPRWLNRLAGWEERRLHEKWMEASDEVRSACPDLGVFDLGSRVEDRRPFSELRMEGPAFSYMVHTHRNLVVPGLVAAALGVVAASVEVSTRLTVALVAALAVVGVWYVWWRPTLGVD